MNLKKRQPGPPSFLYRNWRDSMNDYKKSFQKSVMAATSPNHKPTVAIPPNDDDGATPPLQKRRRVSSVEPLVPDLLFAPTGSRDKNTRVIEVLKVFHKDSKKVREGHTADVPRDILTTRGHCRITIFDTTNDTPRPLFANSEACRITTYKNPVGPHRIARIYIDDPFLVPDHVLKVNRSDDDNVRDLSDNYKLIVELEAATGSSWPPLDWHDFGIPASEPGPLFGSSSAHWIMSSDFKSIDGRLRSVLNLSTGFSRPSRETNYIMEVALHSRLPAIPMVPEKGEKPCITAVDPDAEPYTNGHFEPVVTQDVNQVNKFGENVTINGVNGIDQGVNGVNRMHDDEVNGHHSTDAADTSHELEDEIEGDRTPTRALRTREKAKNYNLKLLSDQAQGKERKRRGRAAQPLSEEGRVIYIVPANQPIAVDYWRCIMCTVQPSSFVQLQLHLQISHSNYQCILETTSQGPQFRITYRGEETDSIALRTFSLGKATEPFNPRSFISGDESWIASREAREIHAELTPAASPVEIPAQVMQPYDRPQTDSPLPGTRIETTNGLQTQNSPQTRAESPRRKKILVPDNNQQYFEPVSKRQLRPGQEVPSPTTDEGWLLHKHREGLEGYTDMTLSERSYMVRWDAFILRKRLTGSSYFKRAFLEFVRLEASWLVGDRERMLEFAKHSSVLFTRNVLDDSTMNDAFAIIMEARTDLQLGRNHHEDTNSNETQNDELLRSPCNSQTRRGLGGCNVCQLPVVGPRLLVCSNKVS